MGLVGAHSCHFSTQLAALECHRVPEPHARNPIFHGWYVVATLFFAGFALYGAGLYSFILFVSPLSAEFHWSRAATGGLVSAFWLTSPIALFAAPLIARFGSRRLAATGVIIESISLVMLFTASSLWEMYLLRALAGLGKMLYAINLPVIVSRWFSRRFGLATAIIYSGWALGGLVLAPLTELLIRTIGWRGASMALGGGLLVVALPPTLWVLRIPSAESIGLGLDGGPLAGDAELAAASQKASAGDRGTTARLLGLPAFQCIMLGTMAYYLTYSAVLAHQAAIIEGEGITTRIASWTLGSTAGFAALGALFLGWLLDRVALAPVALIQFGMMIGGVACLLASTYSPLVTLLGSHAILFGLAVGGSEPFWITLIRRRVPFDNFQQAWGIAYFLELAFIVIGPFAAGFLFDVFGSYEKALWSELALITIPLVLSLILARKPPAAIMNAGSS